METFELPDKWTNKRFIETGVGIVEDSFRKIICGFDGVVDIFPMFGTLLGIVRDQVILPHDIDMDFGFNIDDREKLLEELESRGYNIVRNSKNGGIITVTDGDVCIDFYSYDMGGDWIHNNGAYSINLSDASPLRKKKFLGVTYLSLNKPESWLEKYYGPDWTETIVY